MRGFALFLVLMAPARHVQVLEVHPGMPPLEVRILPGPMTENVWKDAKAPHRIGRVEIVRKGERKPFQTIEVRGDGTPLDLERFRFDDVNFDGYTDLLLGRDGDSNWESYEIHFYDPASGSFIQNALSRDMSKKLAGYNLIFHPDKKEILLIHRLGRDTYNQTFVLRDGVLKEITGEK